MRTWVWPEPAGAWTMKLRSGSSARSRRARSGASAIVAFLAGRAHGQPLAHAAERLLVAVLASLRAVARVDVRVALRIALADPRERGRPLPDEVVPVLVQLGGRTAFLDRLDIGQQPVLAREALEAEPAGLHVREHDSVDALGCAERIHRKLRLLGAILEPLGDPRLARLVVDHRVASRGEAIHAVEARLHLDPAELERRLRLVRHDGEIRALRFDREPRAQE